MKGQHYFNQLSPEVQKYFTNSYSNHTLGVSSIEEDIDISVPEELRGLWDTIKGLAKEKKPTLSLEEYLDRNFNDGDEFIGAAFPFAYTELGGLYWTNIRKKFTGEDVGDSFVRHIDYIIGEYFKTTLYTDIHKDASTPLIIAAIVDSISEIEDYRDTVSQMMPGVYKYVSYAIHTGSIPNQGVNV